jgi:hypothetical protein
VASGDGYTGGSAMEVLANGPGGFRSRALVGFMPLGRVSQCLRWTHSTLNTYMALGRNEMCNNFLGKYRCAFVLITPISVPEGRRCGLETPRWTCLRRPVAVTKSVHKHRTLAS